MLSYPSFISTPSPSELLLVALARETDSQTEFRRPLVLYCSAHDEIDPARWPRVKRSAGFGFVVYIERQLALISPKTRRLKEKEESRAFRLEHSHAGVRKTRISDKAGSDVSACVKLGVERWAD